MEIIVCLKRVPDTAEAEVKIAPSGVAIESERLTFDVNEADNYALEEALLLKEKVGGQITLITLGDEESEDTLRMGLAKGADHAIRLADPSFEGSDAAAVARILAAAIRTRPYDIIFTGCASADFGESQVGPMLAANLGIAHAVMATKLTVQDDKQVRVERESEGGGFEAFEIQLPVVLAMQTGYNEPRYASIMKIRKAARKEIQLLDRSQLQLAEDQVGRSGSFSWIEQLFTPESGKMAEILTGTPEEAAEKLAGVIKERGIL